jgi:23S rRNA pseudouridine1911/1915/1917 synthase
MAGDPPLELRVTEPDGGKRLDAFLAEQYPQLSRVQLRRAISQGTVWVDGRLTKPAYRLVSGQEVRLVLPPTRRDSPSPEAFELDVLYEDDHVVAINKPPRMVVHPSKGHRGGTLANALAHHFQQLSGLGGTCRPGIVHRLDRDTSGLILIAKTDAAHAALAAQWADRTIEKSYVAVVVGVPDRDRDQIDQPIGAHPYQRERMAIRAHHPTARAASTVYEMIERFAGFAALRVHPKTGRTHQIRVHLTHIGYPVLCDRLYGGRAVLTMGDLCRNDDPTVILDRQALHAESLRFLHPESGEPMELRADLPADLAGVLEALRRHRPRTSSTV